MTPDEAIDKINNLIAHRDGQLNVLNAVIRTAVEAEREACAKIFEDVNMRSLAKIIRSRGSSQ